MRKTIIVIVLFLSLVIIPEIGEAAVVFPSKGKVDFIPNDDQTAPVDPTDPQTPVEPETPGGQPPEVGQSGPLSIDFASSFSFGVNRISNKDQVYYADAQVYHGTSNVTPNYVQITDNRGTSTGWTLTVKQLRQFQSDEAILKGAFISFSQSHINSQATGTFSPEAQQITSLLPNASESVVMTADLTEGAGTWEDYWGSVEVISQEKADGTFYSRNVTKAVQLHVPGRTPKIPKNYQTTLVWSLKEIPRN